MRQWIYSLMLIMILSGCSEPAPPSAGSGSGGQGYLTLKEPLSTSDGDHPGTEVLEFFSYGCDHCARFNPQLENWALSHPAAHVRKVPVLFSRPQFETLGRLYFALQDLGRAHLDDAVFEAIHAQGRDLSVPDLRKAWALENGIPPEMLERKMDSPEIANKVNAANALAVEAGIEGVPTLVIGGRYSTSLDQAGSFENMLGVAGNLMTK